MAAVVFMRAVNIAGRKRFRPAAFAREISAFEVVNIGAAGTFIVHGRVGHAALRAELLRRLPVEADFMICRAQDVVELVSADPFPPEEATEAVRRYVTVLARRPSKPPRFPLARPEGGPWQVKLVGLRGRFVLGLQRRGLDRTLYPNEVVEKEMGLRATTRNWDTMRKVRDRLSKG